MSDSETRGRPPGPWRPPGEAQHIAGEGGVAAPAGVRGDPPRPGGGGGRLGQSLAGVQPEIHMLKHNKINEN